jgi:hypothetical protein
VEAGVPLQPPYFEARVLGHSYRVYVLPDCMLFLDCPLHEDRSAAETLVRGVSWQGGLVGVLVGNIVANRLARDRQTKTYARHGELNLASPQILLALADEEPDSFRIDFADIKSVGIDGLGFWQRAINDGIAARLHFWHPVRGQVEVDLPCPEDVRVAMTHLGAILGDQLETDAVWDWENERFVSKA